MQIEYIAGVRFTSWRSFQQQREGTVSHGVLGQVVVYHEDVLALVHEVLAHGAAGIGRDILQRRQLRSGSGNDDGIIQRAPCPELLNNAGVRPAVNPGISVSRVGGNAQIKAMKKVAGTLKLDYSQYRELQSFAQFGSDLDKDTKDRLAKGERIVEVLKQDQNSPLEVEEQVVIIYAVVHNFLRDIPVEKIKQYQTDLLDHIKSTDPEILTSIKTEKVITPDNEEKLQSVLTDFAKGYTA